MIEKGGKVYTVSALRYKALFPLSLKTLDLSQPHTFVFLDNPGLLHLTNSSKCPLSNK